MNRGKNHLEGSTGFAQSNAGRTNWSLHLRRRTSQKWEGVGEENVKMIFIGD